MRPSYKRVGFYKSLFYFAFYLEWQEKFLFPSAQIFVSDWPKNALKSSTP